jgi:GTP-binding protein HflX
MLFATLDTSVRRIDAPGHVPFLLSDTVGFVSELPHALVKAFRSTLDEVRYADLLLEVVDFSDPDYRDQIEVTAKTLEEIGAGNIPLVYLYNKTDLAMASEAETGLPGSGQKPEKSIPSAEEGSGPVCRPSAKSRPIPVKIPFRRGDTLYLAAGKGIGIPEILSLIDSALEEDRIECRFLVPYTKGGLLQEMRRYGVLLSEEYLPEGTAVRVRCRRGDARRFQTLLRDS